MVPGWIGRERTKLFIYKTDQKGQTVCSAFVISSAIKNLKKNVFFGIIGIIHNEAICARLERMLFSFCVLDRDVARIYLQENQ